MKTALIDATGLDPAGRIYSGCLRQTLPGESTALSVQSGSDRYGVLNTYIFDPFQW